MAGLLWTEYECEEEDRYGHDGHISPSINSLWSNVLFLAILLSIDQIS
jgi:hypothetical protein